MSLITRQFGPNAKGSKLTIQEMDDNLLYLESLSQVTNITYSELYTKVVNGELVAGAWYRLTDYKSVNFLNGWETANNNPTPTDPNFDPQEIYTGETEVLILQATSPYEIAEIGYSETFQGDIVQYEPYINKIGIDIGGISNGQTLPDSSTVSGFDLQWDGTNVYFNMPTGYPLLFGHYLYLYCEFDGGNYSQDGVFEPLTPNISICQYPYTSDDVEFGYPKAMSRIKVEDNGMKVILLDLTETDYLNYDADSLFVDTVYALGDAYGWITRRQDTLRNIDVPFDFRGRKYRRFEVDLSSVNAALGTWYWGIGDDFLGQGTTGNYKDFKSLGNDGYETYNIKWSDMGGADMYYYRGYNDNNVCLGNFNNNSISNSVWFNTFDDGFIYNTIGESLNNNTISVGFYYNKIEGFLNNNTIGKGFSLNNIKENFVSNNILNNFEYNTIGDGFTNNTVGNTFNNNTVGNTFNSNTVGNSFSNNTVGNIFELNTVGNTFSNNTVGDTFRNNTVSDGFGDNMVGNGFDGNTIGNVFIDNVIANKFFNNIISNTFTRNIIDFSPNNTDFSTATHVYGNYTCRIFKSNDTNLYLEYFSGTTATYVSPTT